ncbi:iron uptake transporter deferrochelatase/peroxidase subunit [Nocardioides maradonensis]
MSGLSRRTLFAGAGGGLALGAAAGYGVASATEPDAGDSGNVIDLDRSFAFYAPAAGGHQAGIETPPQRHSVLMTFDIVDGTTRTDLQVLFARWSSAIAQLMQGKPVGSVQPDRPGAVPDDTGEAYDLAAAGLTVTFGLGPGVFDDRFGLAGKRPAKLKELPALPSDTLEPALSGGDLMLQACADDPQVAYHAIRDLARMARGTAHTRWTVMGFGRASAGAGQSTPRNLQGFKDGTRNIKESSDLDEFVWLSDGDDVEWMTGGAYMVSRKIRMDIETWDADDVANQQQVIGRSKIEGAPLSGAHEFDTPDFAATGADGKPTIDATSHVALAAHENNNGLRILRRGYNYTDGLNDLGLLDAGLLFIGFMKDPQQFITLQEKLGRSDQLNEYIAHIGSALFAVPPAPRQGSYLAAALFA